MALSAVAVFLRLSWRTVTGIVARVVADLTGKTDQLDGLRRIGIDEIAYRKGHRYLTCVVDHDTGRLVWAHEGRNKDTLRMFFQALGESRSAVLTHVSADGAEWIHAVVKEHAPQAVLCLDPYHVVAWVTKALDKVRRRTLEQAGGGDRNARWAVIKNPSALTPEQRGSLARIKTTNTALYRAYLLKEQLRAVFAVKGQRGKALLAGWIAWARRSRLPEFVTLARTIQRFQQLIWNTLRHNLSNALSEATNTHIRALTKRAYGYHSPEARIAMATPRRVRGRLLLARDGPCRCGSRRAGYRAAPPAPRVATAIAARRPAAALDPGASATLTVPRTGQARGPARHHARREPHHHSQQPTPQHPQPFPPPPRMRSPRRSAIRPQTTHRHPLHRQEVPK